jgi:hypothetical protein
MSDDFQFPEPEPGAEQTPAPLRKQRSPLVLPWMVAGLAVVVLAVVSLYAKKLINDQTARAYQAMRMADEYASRANRMEADQKDARRQAITSSEKTDELRAANTRLTEQVTDKDSALAHLKDRHRHLVTDLRAALRSSKGKALSKRVDRILAHDAAVERAEAPQALTSQSPDAAPTTLVARGGGPVLSSGQDLLHLARQLGRHRLDPAVEVLDDLPVRRDEELVEVPGDGSALLPGRPVRYL